MRAARLTAVGQLAIQEIEDPVARGDTLLVRIEACGICGTDRHIYQGDYPAALPVTLGHEFAGTVVAAGIDSPLAIGTRVAVDPNIPCGVCRECRRGDVALCPNRVALGVDLDGGLAAFVAVPRAQAYPLPDGVPIEYGALCEPLACCLRGLDLVGIRPGMSVAVLGGGVIDQLMVQLAAMAGATQVILITRQAGRRVLAETLGATASLDPASGALVARVAGPAGLVPGGVDVALECVGAVETFEQCVAIAGRGGTVLAFGAPPQGAMARISPFEIFARELRILGSYLNPHTNGRAVELIASGRLQLERLITHRLGLEEAPGLITAAPAAGEVKAIIFP